MEELDIGEEVEGEDDANDVPTTKKKKTRVVDYGRISTALNTMKSSGVQILPPDINRSTFTFTPLAEQNAIAYGLRGITRLSISSIQTIIANRPYKSLSDFIERNKLGVLPMINLIKSGAFDSLNSQRAQIMRNYLMSRADTKQRLTLQNMAMLIRLDCLPEDMAFYGELFEFNKFLKANKSEEFYTLTEGATNFIIENFDADVLDSPNLINQKVWDKLYDKRMDVMRSYLKEHKDEMLEKLNNRLIQDQWDKYANGSVSRWEMESLNFYYHDHELASIDNGKYGIVDFFGLPETQIVSRSFTTKDGYDINIFQLDCIAGTVLDKNKLKHTVTLLTTTGVVTVKIYDSQFSKYDRQISERGLDGHKHVVEKSWFSRGNLLMIQGCRRGQNWIPKKYKDSRYQSPIMKITKVEGNYFEYIDTRAEVEE